VKLHEWSGKTYGKAEGFLGDVAELVRQKLAIRETQRPLTARPLTAPIKPPSAFHQDPRFGGDLHRADLAWAIYTASIGLSEQEIKDVILYARDLSKKGRPNRQLDYAERTALKALGIVRPTR
jgi:hypothetical protein